MSKKKTIEYKRNGDGKEPPKYLTEFEIRALISNELVFLKEPVHIVGGSIVAGNPNGTGLKLGKDGIMPGSDPSIQGWGNTMTFSAVDADTVQWSAGTLTLTDGTIYNIEAGNTGNMSALNYIYFDINISKTILQKTTTQATAVGRGKILVAVAQNNAASEATFQVFGGSGGILIKADNIAANSITANEIAANTITASQLSVAQLSAISANLGTVTAGTINGNTINGGVITGSLIQTNSGSSGPKTVINSSANWIEFQYDGSSRASIFVTSAAGNPLLIDAANNCYVGCDDWLVNYNDDNNGADAYWSSNGNLRMYLNSSGNLSIDGTYSDGGADFAEMFESLDGKSIPKGTPVTLEGDKIRPAKSGEIPFGVISTKPTIIGNLPVDWNGKYLKDEFGEIKYEEVEWWSIKKATTKKLNKEKERRLIDNLPINGYVDKTKQIPLGAKITKVRREILNPDYDPSLKYVSRENRPEWNIVGIIGRLPILKGHPVAPNWIKLKGISETVEEWLIR